MSCIDVAIGVDFVDQDTHWSRSPRGLLLPTELVTLVRLTLRVCAFVTPVPVPHLDWTTEVSLLFMNALTVTLVKHHHHPRLGAAKKRDMFLAQTQIGCLTKAAHKETGMSGSSRLPPASIIEIECKSGGIDSPLLCKLCL